PPRRIEQIVLGLLTLAGAGMVGYCLVSRQSLLAPLPRSMLVIWVGVWAGMLYTLYLVGTGRRWPADRPIPSMEGIMLGAMALTSAGLTAATWPRPAGPVRAEVVWTFEVPRPEQGRIVSTPLVEGGRLYAAAALGSGFPYGALYCLDRETGRPRADFNRGRPFDDGGDLKQVFSSPCAADGRLYLGEGFHQDSFCKLYCLDAATGQKLWHVPTKGHTESSPCVADGKVYIGAGDDGLYCVEAVRGKVLWHFEGPHVDCTPVVVDGRLYGGSGYGTYEVFCLDARTGNLVWRVPVDLPAFATPAATPDGRVVFGIGNGNLLASAGTPAGALLCLDGRTGALLWRFDVGDGVHRQPAVDDRHVYCVTRDCHCYCVRLADGALVWKKELNSPVAAAPALARSPQHDGRPGLYIAASRGTIYCLDPDTGAVRWTFDVAEHSQAQPLLLSSPIVVTDPTGSGPRRRIYFGAELVNPLLESTPAVYCLEERP
ncbi:MAG TPA: PQQ-binding-like beta-propeller repeat protein, partial [Gemmataceae bacterium]|nr:PQQ-binding-like beta-propeller repeat protein [Gemmataceae bacterium]